MPSMKTMSGLCSFKEFDESLVVKKLFVQTYNKFSKKQTV